jgi:molybdate transport repressor ModE-like protein
MTKAPSHDAAPPAPPLQNRIRLGHLRLLAGIAETGSLLATAKRLHISQPAATKSLKQLEEAIGGSLVRRTSGGSVLTPSGEMMCRRARVILAELQHMEEELGSFHVGGAGQVVLGTLAVAASQLVPRTLAALAADYPRITVRVVEGTSATLYSELKLGKLDLLVGRSWPGEDAALLTETLFDSGFSIAARPGHPLVADRRKKLQLRDTAKAFWILPPPGAHSRSALESMFIQAGLQLPLHCVETSSYVVIRSLLLATDMVCLLPVEALAEDIASKTLARLPVDVDLPLPAISVVRSADRELAPAAGTLLGYLRESARAISADEVSGGRSRRRPPASDRS